MGDTPYSIGSNLEAWWVADDLNSKADSDAIPSWSSRVRSRTLVQATGGFQPILKKGMAAANGHSAVRFDGVDDRLQVPSFALAQPFSLYVVAAWRAATADSSLCDGTTGNSAVMYIASGAYALFAGATLSSGLAPTLNQFYIHQGTFVTPSGRIRRNGGTGVAGSVGSAVPGGFTVGSRATGTNPSSSDISEVIVVRGKNRKGLDNRIHRYLASKYKLPWTRIGV